MRDPAKPNREGTVTVRMNMLLSGDIIELRQHLDAILDVADDPDDDILTTSERAVLLGLDARLDLTLNQRGVDTGKPRSRM